MSTTNFTEVALQKVRSVSDGELIELKSLWENQSVAIIFFRRWGCMLCRLWAKELGEIAPILKKHNINLVGVGIEEAGCKDFVNGKYFDGDLYYVENMSTYQLLGFKRFNIVSIISTLFWKQSRDAIFKGRGMGITCDLVGDGLQNGGALLVLEGGKILYHFISLGPADYMPNKQILENFGLEHEFTPEMANKKVDEKECVTGVMPVVYRCMSQKCGLPPLGSNPFLYQDVKRQRRSSFTWLRNLDEYPIAPIHSIWTNRRCKNSRV